MSSDEIKKYGKWMYEFELGNGIKTPLYVDSLREVHDVRHSMIFSFLDSVCFDYKYNCVLDIACNEGYFTFEMLKRGCNFGLGVEARAENIEKAIFIKRTLQYQNCDFKQGDIFDVDISSEFGVVLLLGIIYHVENPLGLLRKAASLTSKFLFVETQLCQSGHKIPFGRGTPNQYSQGGSYFVLHHEKDEQNPLASIGGFSLVPNLSAIVEILRELGFQSVIQLHPNRQVQEFQYNNVDRTILVGIK
ncbi:MAG: class I SAM-dependent methyltransferase [Aphanothece sp. CMT-3BRIN-NPC111]|jgi:SAM-dependent methyltransferase|nr:class I SAM-dependent methyltransferase [Aphanothece sp. CMT-3BRIN-NPC111]